MRVSFEMLVVTSWEGPGALLTPRVFAGRRAVGRTRW